MRTRRPTDWAQWELEILAKAYPAGGAQACRDAGIKRTISSIRCRASKLGHSLDPKAVKEIKRRNAARAREALLEGTEGTRIPEGAGDITRALAWPVPREAA